MRTINTKQKEKIKVLSRLLANHEKIEIACSKAGLSIKVAKKLLSL
jgi:hypothetical protein